MSEATMYIIRMVDANRKVFYITMIAIFLHFREKLVQKIFDSGRVWISETLSWSCRASHPICVNRASPTENDKYRRKVSMKYLDSTRLLI